MSNFITVLKFRNEPLYYFGLICLISAVIFFFLSRISSLLVAGTNAWYKPLKFALSIGSFCWTMGWYTWYLKLPGQVSVYSWVTILLLAFELIYIALQAGRGELSHYNRSTPLYAALYSSMALAATFVTFHTGYMGMLFCTRNIPELPGYYLWAIRIGILLFVVFAMEGAVMGGRMSHTIGGTDDGHGLPFLNWSRKFGDPRIAHFVGMHSLQILPLLAFYVLKDVRWTLFFGALYGCLALLVLIQALNGRPLIR